jgi:formate dehydrogenase maturation protein FdhE
MKPLPNKKELDTMWKDVRKMSREEIVEELEALKKVREITTKVSVDKLLNKELDLEPLRKVNLTIAANGALYRRVKGMLPELMEKIYKDRTVYKKKMLAAKQQLVDVEEEMKRRGIL